MAGKVLIIDDKMHPQGPSEPIRESGVSEQDLANKIKFFFESQGLEVDFRDTGNKGINAVGKDFDQSIKLVILDILFENQRMQGPSIFKKISTLRKDLPVVVITVLPSYTNFEHANIFKTFRGAELIAEKSYFATNGKEQIDFLKAIISGKKFEYVLQYKSGFEYQPGTSIERFILDIDILREEKDHLVSVLRESYRVPYPQSHFVKQCCDNFPGPVHWKQCKELASDEDMDPTLFQKKIDKLNDRIELLSSGRVPHFLLGRGTLGRSLGVARVERVRTDTVPQ